MKTYYKPITTHFILLVLYLLSTTLTVFAQTNELTSLQNATRSIAKTILPSVVTLDTRSTVKVPVRPSLNFFFDPFNRKKEEPQEREYNQEGLGSGIIVEKRGNKYYVLTNAHVVEDVDEVTVITLEEKEFKATIVGFDQARDLSLVSFESTESFPQATLGNSDSLQQGDIVFAVGNPYGFRSSITFGIVSALDRKMGPRQDQNRFSLTNYIQTDAAVNRGNSGGPLVNIDGEVIGINTWIYSSSGGGNDGLSFAVPINNAKTAIVSLIEKGSVDYGWLGVSYTKIFEEEMMSLDIKNGILLHGVHRNSPADRAGIRPGDIIISVNDTKIKEEKDLINTIAIIQPGEKAMLKIMRKGKLMELEVILSKRKNKKELIETYSWPGFTAFDITSSLRTRLELSGTAGVVVVAVEQNSPAAIAGLQQGDVIERVNNKKIKNLKEFYQELNDIQKNEEVIFRLVRNKTNLVIGLLNE